MVCSLGVELMAALTAADLKRVQRAIDEGKPAPDGPRLEKFHPLKLADALELEIERSKLLLNARIDVSMTIDDARRLMQFLRKR